ncbi:hypothetical protein PLESTB_001536300 [Pleodorina starrii]|uniref:Uncharacterized protein n=1 Tax=Pleodorina starrii TaxID=330485 RepID=A0A9W6BXA5_9CHLO|nr:hypothetical protein PLESTM_001841500 [Pleodorina starrii]GLC59793.1 hypothetical protein PLESTB_001536300 [Pleodorina starrii]GLC67324.1 hypothetical protein PLESTF_000542500 [Pleodorina starrii]
MSSTQMAFVGVAAAAVAGAVVAAVNSKRGRHDKPMSADVEFMLARAASLQQQSSGAAPGGSSAAPREVTLEALVAALEATRAALQGGAGKGPAPAQQLQGPACPAARGPAGAADGALTKKELEDTMKALLQPPGGMSGGDADMTPLERFTQDLTEAARAGKLDPVIGRDEEIRRVMHILCRRTKNNPVLVGETGVGKTALVEGLAQRLVAGDVPYSLMGCRIVELDLGSLTAGAMMPGEFEDRLKAVLQEVAASRGRVLLFIDDIHNLVPAMGQQGATMLDGGALLKPFLSRGELRCIGASSTDKFKKTIEKDPGLERRFQQVFVDQPSVSVTISILRGLRPHYERHHGVSVGEDALVAAAQLSARYIAGRFLPDKAIDLMDEATAQVKMEMTLRPSALDSLERRLKQLDAEVTQLTGKAEGGSDKTAATCLQELKAERSDVAAQRDVVAAAWKQERDAGLKLEQLLLKKQYIDMEVSRLEEALANGDVDADDEDDEYEQEEDMYETGYGGHAGPMSSGRYGRASKTGRTMLAHLRTQQADVEASLVRARAAEAAGGGAANAAGTNGGRLVRNTVSDGDIAAVISRWTGIPVTKLIASERERLLGLQDELHRRIIGQEEAVDAVAEAVQRSRADVADLNGPIASFMFLGPTGVGKTELAKALAAYLFNTEEAMVRLDMSEYMEKHAVSRLIGAPPGYVGYEEGGMLTDAVRRRPYSVVLFDEIEKAHVDVFNVLLQILDDGRITDAQGRTVSFKNTVIIMTSNLGSAEIFAAVAGGGGGGDNGDASAPADATGAGAAQGGGDAAASAEEGAAKSVSGSRADRAALKEKVMEHVRSHFRPEFINRVDEFITFDPLQADQIIQIVKLRAEKLTSRLAERRMKLQLTDPAVEFLASKGYDPAYGARPVKRALQRELQTLLAQALLRDEFQEGDIITVSLRPDGAGLALARSCGGNGNGDSDSGPEDGSAAEPAQEPAEEPAEEPATDDGAEKVEVEVQGEKVAEPAEAAGEEAEEAEAEAEGAKANGHGPTANGVANGHANGTAQ